MIIALKTVLDSTDSAACNHPIAECKFAFKIPCGKLYTICESLVAVSDRTRAFWQLFCIYPQSIGNYCSVCRWCSISCSVPDSQIDILSYNYPHNTSSKIILLPPCDLKLNPVIIKPGYHILVLRKLMTTIDLCLRKVGIIKDLRRLIIDCTLEWWKHDVFVAIDEYHSTLELVDYRYSL